MPPNSGHVIPANLIEFQQRLQAIIPQKSLQNVWNSFSIDKPLVLRVNTLKTQPKEVIDDLRQQDINVTLIDWKSDCIVIPVSQRRAVLESTIYQQGLIYSQNLSSQLAPYVLAAQASEEILDLCAAPGGKTLQIACMMGDTGRIAAVESVKSRFFKLKANIKQQGANIINTYLADGRNIWRKTPERFDRVLVDAPCSSESRIQLNNPKSYQYWRVKKVKEMARKQQTLLYSGFQSLKPGGVLVYSTCSFAPEENESVVSKLVQRHSDALEIEPINLPISNTQAGIEQWKNRHYDARVKHSVRVLPNEIMDGFYLCLIRKLKSTV